MNRLTGLFDGAQQVGARIGAYKNIGWLALVLAGVGVVAFRYAVSMGAFLLTAVVALLVSACLLLTALILYRRLSGPGYRWVSAEYVYRFDPLDLRNQTQVINIKIRALRDNVCCFENSYYWSGTGNSEVRVTSAGHRYVGEVPADDSKKLYWIHLDTPLSRGEEADIQVQQELFDDRRSLKPMLTKRVSQRLDSLTLKAVFPQPAVPPSMVAREMTYSKKPPHWRVAQLDEPRWRPDGVVTEISYSPPKPRTKRRYELKWDPWVAYSKPDISS